MNDSRMSEKFIKTLNESQKYENHEKILIETKNKAVYTAASVVCGWVGAV